MIQRLILGLALLLLFSFDAAHAHRVIESRDLIRRFYDDPLNDTTLTLETQTKKVRVEICADVCDAFGGMTDSEDHRFWDAVLLFKVFVSRSTDDQRFAQINANFAADLLRGLAVRSCKNLPGSERQVLCVIREFERHWKFQHEEVRYDEGNRCVSRWSFDVRPRLIGSKCLPVSR